MICLFVMLCLLSLACAFVGVVAFWFFGVGDYWLGCVLTGFCVDCCLFVLLGLCYVVGFGGCIGVVVWVCWMG